MMVQLLMAQLLLTAAIVMTCYGQDGADDCNQYKSCDECIANGIGCVWCPDPHPFSGPRCTSSHRANCSSELEDPVAQPPQILREAQSFDQAHPLPLHDDRKVPGSLDYTPVKDPLGEAVQITPQEIRLHLRRGEPQTFTLSVKPARNYPLDLYFLMDLSGSQALDLVMLRNLSNSIIEELERISSQFTLGFGSYVDKIAYPYASTLQNGRDYMEFHLTRQRLECANGKDSCEPTYLYRHHLPLTSNDNSQFRDVLDRVTIAGNLDAPEATLEALLQSAACVEHVGWRNDSLRIVMVLTDAGFKTALDGKVAALLTRNDGECHLQPNEEGFYDYVRDPEQDYPSIYQVREKLIENDIITIFAVAENITASELAEPIIYTQLAKDIGSSRAFYQTIANDSADIVSVIRKAYENITKDIVVESITDFTVAVNPISNCNPTSDGMGCANVGIGQQVKFSVTITMDQCFSGVQSELLTLPGFGSVNLILVPICECKCSSERSPNHLSCNSQGSLVCGSCDCLDGYNGDQCECMGSLGPCPNECFNRGICDNCTRKCVNCDTYEEIRDGVVLTVGSYGERCQCDNFTSKSCPVGRDLRLVCNGRGDCVCSSDGEMCGCNCDCGTAPLSQKQYSREDCGCDPDNCYNELYPGRECAHNKDSRRDGLCDCNECNCTSDDFVAFNRTCIRTEDLCGRFEECARCWPMSCGSKDCHSTSLDVFTSSGDPLFCQFEQDTCTVDYLVVLSGPSSSMATLYVGEERDCKTSDLSNLVWIIPVSIVGVILLLGVVLLIIAQCIWITMMKVRYKSALKKKQEDLDALISLAKRQSSTRDGDLTRQKLDEQETSSSVHFENVHSIPELRQGRDAPDALAEVMQEMSDKGLLVPESDIAIKNVVGEGEFGIVYKALQRGGKGRVHDLVAVKTLKGLFCSSDVKHLAEESQIMARFDHPNVMKLLGVSISKSRTPFIVMPFMARGTLLSYLRRNRENLTIEDEEMTTEQIEDTGSKLLSMCLQIVKGMEYLAFNKFVHRDLAARNCMIDLNNVIKVADFGLTEDVYARNYFRQTGPQEDGGEAPVKLPVKWMALESLNDGVFSEKTDVWSFGVTCWEVFSLGKRPYPGVDPFSLVRYLERGRRLDKPLNAACSEQIYGMMRDCWEGQPWKRPTFSQLVAVISTRLEAGYLDLNSSTAKPNLT